MSGDPFPIYCRQCHRAIAASARVCPHCGATQGLAAQAPPAAPPRQQQQTQYAAPAAAPPGAAPAAQGVSTCYSCMTQVTPGDVFCRACGRPLVAGIGGGSVDAGQASAKAYGISALVCALLGFGPGAVILGLVAMVKGSRGLGCAAIIIGIGGTVLFVILGAGLIQEALRMFPGVGTGGIPPDLLP